MQKDVGNRSCGRGAGLGVALALVSMLGVLYVAPAASADVAQYEVNEYVQDAGVSAPQAEETLEVQQAGAESGIVEGLEQKLDEDYAGVWFDNATAEFVVPVLPDSSLAAVDAEIEQAGLGESDFRASPAEFSWHELEAAQDEIDAALDELLREGLLQTSLDARRNAVVITVVADASDSVMAQVDAAAEGSSVDVEVDTTAEESASTELLGCAFSYAHYYLSCDAPMRGGTLISPSWVTGPEGGQTGCSAGFKAISNTTGDRYVLTAGHCVDEDSEWVSFTAGEQRKYLGQRAGWSFPGDMTTPRSASTAATGIRRRGLPRLRIWAIRTKRGRSRPRSILTSRSPAKGRAFKGSTYAIPGR